MKFPELDEYYEMESLVCCRCGCKLGKLIIEDDSIDYHIELGCPACNCMTVIGEQLLPEICPSCFINYSDGTPIPEEKGV